MFIVSSQLYILHVYTLVLFGTHLSPELPGTVWRPHRTHPSHRSWPLGSFPPYRWGICWGWWGGGGSHRGGSYSWVDARCTGHTFFGRSPCKVCARTRNRLDKQRKNLVSFTLEQISNECKRWSSTKISCKIDWQSALRTRHNKTWYVQGLLGSILAPHWTRSNGWQGVPLLVSFSDTSKG